MSAGTILVVDYHREVVSFATAALSHAAFEVISAPNGKDGLEMIDARGGVDLVLSEVLMPAGISGVEFVHEVQHRFPRTVVMLMTGFTEEVVDPEIPLLKKPFAASTLIGRVQRAVAESRRSAEDLRNSCLKLRTNFETNLGLRPEVEAAIERARVARNQSRRIRAEWLRSRLRQAGADLPTVMVVDGDALCRSTTSHYLEGIGLRVLRASNGEVAWEVIRLRHGRVDMLITEVRMSGMDGLELARSVAVLFPRTNIVFATAEDIDAPHQVVRKPFESEDLLAAIAEKLLQRLRELRE
jgi:DNA-binding NtrC family response regulator